MGISLPLHQAWESCWCSEIFLLNYRNGDKHSFWPEGEKYAKGRYPTLFYSPTSLVDRTWNLKGDLTLAEIAMKKEKRSLSSWKKVTKCLYGLFLHYLFFLYILHAVTCIAQLDLFNGNYSLKLNSRFYRKHEFFLFLCSVASSLHRLLGTTCLNVMGALVPGICLCISPLPTLAKLTTQTRLGQNSRWYEKKISTRWHL